MMTPVTWALVIVIVFLAAYLALRIRKDRRDMETAVAVSNETFAVLSAQIRDAREAVGARDAEIVSLNERLRSKSIQNQQYAEENRRMREGFVFTAQKVAAAYYADEAMTLAAQKHAVHELREEILKAVLDAGTIERIPEALGDRLVFRLKVHDLIERSPMTHPDPILRDIVIKPRSEQ